MAREMPRDEASDHMEATKFCTLDWARAACGSMAPAPAAKDSASRLRRDSMGMLDERALLLMDGPSPLPIAGPPCHNFMARRCPRPPGDSLMVRGVTQLDGTRMGQGL